MGRTLSLGEPEVAPGMFNDKKLSIYIMLRFSFPSLLETRLPITTGSLYHVYQFVIVKLVITPRS